MDPRNLPEMPELMIVGPGELHEEDLAVLGRQVIAHYGDVWTELHQDTLRALSDLLGAAELPYLIPGSGTTCLDATMMNLFSPGETVVVANTGFFGARLIEIARQQRLNVIVEEIEIGSPADAERLGDAVRSARAAGVVVTHVETSTGVRHPIEDIARAAHDAGAICMVDGIASIGGELCPIDAMGIDALVTSTQKGLEAPPGLGIIALGPGGRARVDSRAERPPSWYMDLKIWDRYRDEWGSWHPHPVTMPAPLVLALASSLQRILAVGLGSWVAARAELARRCRDGLRDQGLTSLPREGVESNMVVAVYADDALAIQKHVLGQGIQISGGLAPLAGKTLRIGLMGRTATQAMVDRLLDAVALARKEI